ncbi:hypothetical protein [Terriglobus tenax]|uniref:hypothetical protein n=1 Tax=Terriglobus tenax TaxID=1111115 RepID=UPI0021E00675|nr:hypothetical protein [Terriglobus tenax]
MSESTQSIRTISCAEFQEQLPELFANAKGGKISDNPIYAEHLRTCDNCSALVRDLEYIAEQARLLLDPGSEAEPSDDVWSNIQSALATSENNGGGGKPNGSSPH